MRWLHEVVEADVLERAFVLHRGQREVPGLLWSPVGQLASPPLVLICHGASGSKREAYVVSLAHRLARHGITAVAIDGPVHGARRPDPGHDRVLALLQFSQAWSSDASMTDEMVADWRQTLDELQALDEIGRGPVGWWGLSMGTIIGLPVVAADPRISVAVLGLAGLTGPTRQRLVSDAPRVGCPVLFIVQWHDELFDRATALELFDALGTDDKRLHAFPGRHADVSAEAFADTASFLEARLGAARPDG
ncbi:MAG TPA: alpha/beta fold hydrolase [Acidimicrobiales bacterium]|nr:alpha/beta fold hydrolase [Acidimicrobiales bacterium]